MYHKVCFDNATLDDTREHVECRRNARKKIITDLYIEMYRRELADGVCRDSVLQSLYDIVDEDKKDKVVKFLWITINPKEDDFALSALQGRIERLKGKKYVKNLYWTFEQRGESLTDVHGIHCHMLLECQDGVRKDSVKRSLHTLFDKLCGNCYHVNIKGLRDSWVNDKLDYLRGHKWSETKDDKVSTDVQWRQEIGLQQIYEFSAGPLLVEAENP